MILQLSKFHPILNIFLTCAAVYVNTSRPHKDRHTHRTTHGTIPPIKDVRKTARLPQSETSLFIYLREFRVITGITAVLGCDISLENQVHGAPSGDMPGRKCDSFPPLISNQIKQVNTPPPTHTHITQEERKNERCLKLPSINTYHEKFCLSALSFWVLGIFFCFS